jgi:predicted NBD/HSP70 family sugar kinase
MVLLTIGTGVGGGIIINGSLYEGNGGAGELGHTIYVKDGIPCNCGRNGCIEKYVSCIALSDRAKQLLEEYPNSIIEKSDEIYASTIYSAYEQGDECAKVLINEYVEDLSNLVLNYCNIFRPDTIVIGGGITHAQGIINLVSKKCKELKYGYNATPSVNIVASALGNRAGVMASSVCFNK